MIEAKFCGVDIAEELIDGTIRDVNTISWKVGNDKRQHFFLTQYDFAAVPETEEHFAALYFSDEYGRYFGRTIKLKKYIGESTQSINACDSVITPPTWEYIGEFTRPWTKMVTTIDEKGIRHHEWPSQQRSNCNEKMHNWSFSRIDRWLDSPSICRLFSTGSNGIHRP